MHHIDIGTVNLLLGESVVAVPIFMMCAVMIIMEKMFGDR